MTELDELKAIRQLLEVLLILNNADVQKFAEYQKVSKS